MNLLLLLGIILAKGKQNLPVYCVICNKFCTKRFYTNNTDCYGKISQFHLAYKFI